MRAALHLVFIGLLLVGHAPASLADDSWPWAPAPGSRVRVTAPPIRNAVGRVHHWTPDSLVILRDPPNMASASVVSSFHRTSITRLESSKGFKGHAVTGAFLGFLVGSVAGFFVAEEVVGEGADPYGTEFDGTAVVAVWAGTVVLGTALGAFVGGSAKFERWKEVGTH